MQRIKSAKPLYARRNARVSGKALNDMGATKGDHGATKFGSVNDDST